MIGLSRHSIGLGLQALLFALAVFSVDLVTPLGVAVWLLYLIPLALSYWLDTPTSPYWIAGFYSMLIGAGGAFSPPGVALGYSIVNRLLGSAMLWGAAHALVLAKRRDQEQARIQERWRLLASETNDVLWDWDLLTDALWWSDNAQAKFGYDPRTEPSIEAWRARLHPDDRDRILTSLEAARAGDGSGWSGEYRFRLVDGTYGTFLNRGTIVRDDRGTPRHMIGAMIDITDRKRTEAALLSKESQVRRLVECNVIGVILGESGGAITQANEAFLHMVQYTVDDLREGRLRWDRLTPPEFAALDERATRELRTRGSAAPWAQEFIRQDGSRVPVLIGAAALDPAQEPLQCVSFVLDLSNLTRAEQAFQAEEAKFRTLVEQSLTGIYVIQDGKFVYANPHLAEIFGYTPREMLDGLPVTACIVEEDQSMVARNLSLRLDGGVQTLRYSFRGKRRDGRQIHCEVQGTRIEWNGRPAVLGTLLDTTDRKRAEDAVRARDRQFKDLLNNLRLIAIIHDRAGRLVYTNPYFWELTGWKPQDVLHRSYIDHLVPRTSATPFGPDS